MDNQKNNQPSNKQKEPKYWKGDGVNGFLYGVIAALVIGLINMMTINVPHLGLIIGIIIWLYVGMNPKFYKGPEDVERARKELKEYKEKRERQKEAQRAVKQQAVQAKAIDKEQKLDAKMKRNEYKLQKAELKKLKNHMTCPRCHSKDVQALGVHRKGFSVGKAVGGAILTGGIGTLAGFAGKQSRKTDFVCMSCGKKFKR